MIAYLKGSLVEKSDASVVIDTQGVGYEVFCSPNTVARLADVGGACQLYVQTQYRSDGGASLFGFISRHEKSLFLELIKVDSVGPKSALNIMAAAPWDELVSLIEDGDVAALSKLPKISKKTAEHVVVKLKGKLGELLIEASMAVGGTGRSQAAQAVKVQSGARRLRSEATTALSHLGYRVPDVERALNGLDESVWKDGDLQVVIRQALHELSGNA